MLQLGDGDGVALCTKPLPLLFLHSALGYLPLFILGGYGCLAEQRRQVHSGRIGKVGYYFFGK